MLKIPNYIKGFEDGTLIVVFLDGTEIEYKMKRSKKDTDWKLLSAA